MYNYVSFNPKVFIVEAYDIRAKTPTSDESNSIHNMLVYFYLVRGHGNFHYVSPKN